MALQDLLQQIEFSAEKKIKKIEKEKSSKIQQIDEKLQKELEFRKSVKEEEFDKAKEQLLSRKKEEKKHQMDMKLLKLKQQILKKFFNKIKENFSNLEFSKKSDILKKELKKSKELIEESAVVYLPKDNFQKIAVLLKEVGISGVGFKPKVLDFKTGVLIETDDFRVEISLRQIVEDNLKSHKSELSKLLFEDSSSN